MDGAPVDRNATLVPHLSRTSVTLPAWFSLNQTSALRETEEASLLGRSATPLSVSLGSPRLVDDGGGDPEGAGDVEGDELTVGVGPGAAVVVGPDIVG